MVGSIFISGSRKKLIAALSISALIGLSLAMVTEQASSADDCDRVEGTLHEQVTGTNPVQSRGKFKGDIRGEYSFVVVAGGPSQTPEVGHFDGSSEVRTKDGKIFFSDAGAISQAGRGNVVWLSTVSGGTDDWEGATGQLVFRGYVDPATGQGKSDYIGEICTVDD